MSLALTPDSQEFRPISNLIYYASLATRSKSPITSTNSPRCPESRLQQSCTPPFILHFSQCTAELLRFSYRSPTPSAFIPPRAPGVRTQSRASSHNPRQHTVSTPLCPLHHNYESSSMDTLHTHCHGGDTIVTCSAARPPPVCLAMLSTATIPSWSGVRYVLVPAFIVYVPIEQLVPVLYSVVGAPRL